MEFAVCRCDGVCCIVCRHDLMHSQVPQVTRQTLVAQPIQFTASIIVSRALCGEVEMLCGVVALHTQTQILMREMSN